MNKKNEEIRNAAESLSPELKALLAATPLIENLDLKEMAEAARELDRSPEHIAETRKAAFVEDVLRALDEEKIAKSELARRLGKTRQQLSYMLNEEKLNNFTIETMSAIAAALDRHLLVRMLSPDERVSIHSVTAKYATLRKSRFRIDDWSSQTDTAGMDDAAPSAKPFEFAA
ncbi:MAG TPA: helix-turn-helix domain-containing protein [Opitutales bacterium]|nr:helix-turn-helix domain-containing protein [Opitutales bacterium]